MLNNREHRKGFTLIELLFVIAIIGVLTSLGVSMMTKKTEQFKVKKTSLEIQQLLQAAMAYNVDNKGEWPDAGNSSTITSGDLFYKYIPATQAIETNTWGVDAYNWDQPSDKTNIFEVYTDVPTKQIAEQIAAKLPDGYAEKDPDNNYYRISVGITVPAQSLSGLPLLADVDSIDMNINNSTGVATATLDEPNPCPANKTYKMLIFPASFHYSIATQKGWSSCTISQENLVISNTTPSCTEESDKRIHCNITANITSKSNVGNDDHCVQQIDSLTVNYVATCI